MKNIAVFAVLVIIFFTITPASIFSQHSKFLPGTNKNTGYSFAISTEAGFVYGQALELVYQDNRNSNEYLSKLTWDMKPVFYLGLELDFGKKDIMSSIGFYSSVSFKIGIPSDSGHIENRDWQSYSHSSLTDFSKHTNRTREFYWLDAAIGISIPIESFAYFNWGITASWMRFSFEGRNGYGEYPYDSRPIMRYIDFSGQKVHTYKQDWLLLGFGFNIGTKMLSPFTIDLSFKISPIIYCVAFDEHLGGVRFPNGEYSKYRTYKDYIENGLHIEPGCSISLAVRRFNFSLGYSYRYIGQTVGVTYINSSPYPANNNESGAGLSLHNFKFLVKIRF